MAIRRRLISARAARAERPRQPRTGRSTGTGRAAAPCRCPSCLVFLPQRGRGSEPCLPTSFLCPSLCWTSFFLQKQRGLGPEDRAGRQLLGNAVWQSPERLNTVAICLAVPRPGSRPGVRKTHAHAEAGVHGDAVHAHGEVEATPRPGNGRWGDTAWRPAQRRGVLWPKKARRPNT